MLRSRFLVSVFVLTLVLAGVLPVTAPVSAQLEGPGFLSASSSCEQGFFSFWNPGRQTDGNADAMQQPGIGVRVEAWDSVGTYLGAESFIVDMYTSQTYSGVIDYLATPVDTVTFELYYNYEGYILVDEITVPAICGQGCDVLMPIPATAVVGAFMADALTYYEPGNLVQPETTILAGNTAWVLGVDETGAYYKILWVCQYLWVPVGTMGPNYDAVWNGTPLPTDVVE